MNTNIIKIFKNVKNNKTTKFYEVKSLEDIKLMLVKYANDNKKDIDDIKTVIKNNLDNKEILEEQKKRLPIFNIGKYDENARAELSRSDKSTLISKKYIFLEIDNDEDSLEYINDIDEALSVALNGVRYLSYPTFSHKIKGYRKRIIFECSQDVHKNDLSLVYEYLCTKLKAKIEDYLTKEKSINISINFDDAYKKGTQYSMFALTCANLDMSIEEQIFINNKGSYVYTDEKRLEKYREHLSATTKTEKASKNATKIVNDFDLESYLAIEEVISEDEYLSTLKNMINKKEEKLQDRNYYVSAKIKIESDYYHKSINYDTALKAVEMLAFDNQDWKEKNVLEFKNEVDNVSDQVKTDLGFRQYVSNSKYSNFVAENDKNNIDKMTSNFSKAIDLSISWEMVELTEKEKDRRSDNVEYKYVIKKVSAKANLLGLCEEYLQNHDVLYVPNSPNSFYIKKDSVYYEFDFKNELTKELNDVKKAFLNSKIELSRSSTFTFYKKTPPTANLSFLLTNAFGDSYTSFDKIFLNSSFSIDEKKLKDALTTVCIEQGKSLSNQESIYSRTPSNMMVFKNCIVEVEKNGSYNIYDRNENKFINDVFLLEQNFNFLKNVENLKQNIGVKGFKKFLNHMTQDEETTRKVMAFIGMCCFPKNNWYQVGLILYSPGNSGKSKLLEFIYDAMHSNSPHGKNLCLNGDFSELFDDTKNRFTKQSLQDKTCVLLDEMKFVRANEETWKKITGSSTEIIVERKHKDAYAIPVTANFIGATNVPIKASTGIAMKRRSALVTITTSYHSMSLEDKKATNKYEVLDKNVDEIMSYCIHEYFNELRLLSDLEEKGEDTSLLAFKSKKMLEDLENMNSDQNSVKFFSENFLIKFDEKDLQNKEEKTLVGENFQAIFELFEIYARYSNIERTEGKNQVKKFLKQELAKLGYFTTSRDSYRTNRVAKDIEYIQKEINDVSVRNTDKDIANDLCNKRERVTNTYINYNAFENYIYELYQDKIIESEKEVELKVPFLEVCKNDTYIEEYHEEKYENIDELLSTSLYSILKRIYSFVDYVYEFYIENNKNEDLVFDKVAQSSLSKDDKERIVKEIQKEITTHIQFEDEYILKAETVIYFLRDREDENNNLPTLEKIAEQTSIF